LAILADNIQERKKYYPKKPIELNNLYSIDFSFQFLAHPLLMAEKQAKRIAN